MTKLDALCAVCTALQHKTRFSCLLLSGLGLLNPSKDPRSETTYPTGDPSVHSLPSHSQLSGSGFMRFENLVLHVERMCRAPARALLTRSCSNTVITYSSGYYGLPSLRTFLFPHKVAATPVKVECPEEWQLWVRP